MKTSCILQFMLTDESILYTDAAKLLSRSLVLVRLCKKPYIDGNLEGGSAQNLKSGQKPNGMRRWRQRRQRQVLPSSTMLRRAPSCSTELRRAVPSFTEICRAPLNSAELCHAPPSFNELRRAPPSSAKKLQAPSSSTELC